MNKSIALVTGASSGFGMLSTIELAKKGFYVIATMRDINRQTDLLAHIQQNHLEEAILLHPLDVTSFESIQNVKKLLIEMGRIDVLINNAGYAAAGFAEEVPLEEYRRQFETNFFGVIAVTQAVLPIMRKQQHGKIINISSISGLSAFPGLSPYVSSKYALEGFSESLRLEVQPFGIDVILIEPGSYITKIWSKGREIEIAEKNLQEHSPYYSYIKAIKREIVKGEKDYGDPIDVAKLIAKIALQKKVKRLRFPIGKGIKMIIILKKFLPWSIWETIVLKKLVK